MILVFENEGFHQTWKKQKENFRENQKMILEKFNIYLEFKNFVVLDMKKVCFA